LLIFWFYILQNPDGKFYIGHTQNLNLHLANHNRTDSVAGKFTRKNGPWRLVWSETYPTRALAMVREKQIKSWKSSQLITSRLLNPTPAQC
jgi:putative endonuclease